MSKDECLSLRWSNDLTPAGQTAQRHLLIELKAPAKPETSQKRPPINLALVIDRSGSMHGEPMAAARRAATGIAESLTARDQLSLIIFDNEVEVLFSGLIMDRQGIQHASRLIERIHSRGTTDLSGGWFAGAQCAAEVMDEVKGAEGHVMVLSDGCANQGICEPAELQKHAAELAKRGIKTSAVGIGAHYSPLQLDALAEGGLGRLHDAETREDIIDVVMGELGELHAITARNTIVSIDYPPQLKLELFTRARLEKSDGKVSVPLGDIVANAVRPVALSVDVPVLDEGAELTFVVTVRYDGSEGSNSHQTIIKNTQLKVVTSEKAQSRRTNQEVARRVADLMEAALAYRAMQLNEQGDFQLAEAVYEDHCFAYSILTEDMTDASARQQRFQKAQKKVSRSWHGRSKRQAFSRSKKRMLLEQDLRSNDASDWHDHLE